jgi:signal transduction histidine kinase
MGALIENVLDFARGRMGGGIPVKRHITDDLSDVLKATVDEIRASHPQASLIESIHLGGNVYCDPLRISQLLSNLLGNAVTHGSPTTPIHLHIWQEGDQVIISVMNRGTPISPRLLPLLFEPFTRSEAGGRGEGLGLGLYIASQIATAHDGILTVSSSAELGTCFIARFPGVPPA